MVNLKINLLKSVISIFGGILVGIGISSLFVISSGAGSGPNPFALSPPTYSIIFVLIIYIVWSLFQKKNP